MKILDYIQIVKTKLATQTDSQKLMLTAAAAAFAVSIFFFGVLGAYWDGKDYVISIDEGHPLQLKPENHSEHSTEKPTENHSEKPAESH